MNETIDCGWGPIGKGIVPSVLYQVYRMGCVLNPDEEGLWYTFEPGNEVTPSEIAIVDGDNNEYSQVWSNVYGKPGADQEVTVTVTASPELSETYPAAIVVVDGKAHDLGYLANDLTFNMANNDHRISIEWAPGLVETFRVVALR